MGRAKIAAWAGAVALLVLLPQIPVNYADSVARSFGRDCSAAAQCGNLLLVSCRPEVDGPEYYVDYASAEVISTCGGACRSPDMQWQCREQCPPAIWDCVN